MAEFKWFKHRVTGLVGYYPEHFGDLFADVFEEVPSEDVSCVDCGGLEPEVNTEEFTPFLDYSADETPIQENQRVTKNEGK